MLQHRWLIALAALALAACGGAQADPQAAAPTGAAAIVPTGAPDAPSAAAATAAPTAQAGAAPTLEPTAEFRAEPTAAPEQATADTSSATPTAGAQPAANVQPAGGPTRLVIADIGVDYQPISVGLDKQRVPVVPDHEVGWYNLSAGPGQGENIVLWGHVLRFRNAPQIPAPFAHVKDLKLGAAVVLYDRDGKPHNYKVTKQVWVTPDQVEFILPQGKEQVTMVSCIGDKVIQDGDVVDESHRLITIAEPA